MSEGPRAVPVTDPRVLVFTPTGRDATLIQAMLTQAGYGADVTPSVEALTDRLTESSGVAIIAEEALTPAAMLRLAETLGRQPSWSDIPVIVLTSILSIRDTDRPVLRSLGALGNVTLLERPVHPVTALSTVEAAVRARRRQFEVRDYLLERSRTEERVREAQKMEAVGQLAGGVAHEVNNMMTVVLGFGDFALRRLRDTQPNGALVPVAAVQADIEEMVKAGKRAAAITEQLLAFSRRQPRRAIVLKVQEVVADLTKLLQRLAGASIEIIIRIADDLPPIRADRTQLEQVIINLVINARDAITDFGTITITADSVRLGEEFMAEHGVTLHRDCRWVELAVIDSGSGMDSAVRARAFDPFFTTKPVGQGTGLGLSTVYGIVKQSGGYVWLEGEKGSGTTVRLQFPEAEGTIEQQAETVAAPAAGGETVLVVEDEPVVRRLARSALEEVGYEVLEAGDGAEALTILTQVDGRVRLVVSDVVMPRMGGKELEAALRIHRPKLPVLFMSGYPGQDMTDRGLLKPGASFIQKPFSPEELAQRVGEILEQSARD